MFLAPSLLLALALAQSPSPPSPTAHVVRVENGGLLFTDNPAGVSGTDCGYSIAMGRWSLWLFGDVFLLSPGDPVGRYVGAVSNCGLLVPSGRGAALLRNYRVLTDPRTGLARQVLPNAPGEDSKTRLWPFGGWYDAGARTVYLYYAVVRVTGTGAFDFRMEGMGLARTRLDPAHPDSLRFERLDAVPGDTLWWRTADGPTFGAAVTGDTVGPYLYVVGTAKRAGRNIGKLARVRKERIADLAAYEYYAGGSAEAPRWSRSTADAADVEGLHDFPTELSLAYNSYLGGWLAVHSIDIQPRVMLALAPHPWGPYRTVGEIGAPHRALQQAFCYAGKEHPELAEGGGRVIYVTYVDSQRYWLQLLRVTLGQ